MSSCCCWSLINKFPSQGVPFFCPKRMLISILTERAGIICVWDVMCVREVKYDWRIDGRSWLERCSLHLLRNGSGVFTYLQTKLCRKPFKNITDKWKLKILEIIENSHKKVKKISFQRIRIRFFISEDPDPVKFRPDLTPYKRLLTRIISGSGKEIGSLCAGRSHYFL